VLCHAVSADHLDWPATCAQGPNAPRLVIVFDHTQLWRGWEPLENVRLLLQWMIQVCTAGLLMLRMYHFRS
jgi:hypothetical protein